VKQPNDFKINKFDSAECYEASAAAIDGKIVAWPRELTINVSCLSLKDARKLKKWLDKVILWMESK